MIDAILYYLPTVLAIIALMLFSPQTRILCYVVAVLALVSELIPQVINITALVACISALFGMLMEDILIRFHIVDHQVNEHEMFKKR